MTGATTERSVGLTDTGSVARVDAGALHRSIIVKLAAQGFDVPRSVEDESVLEIAGDLFQRYAEQSRLLTGHHAPADARVQAFLDDVLRSVGERVELPTQTVVLDRYGLARQLSLPEGEKEFHNREVSSYRLDNGVLHNPINDRRTTQGVFHVADFGLPVPADKFAVPLVTYARLLRAAFQCPADLMALPFAKNWARPAETMVSLLMRPLVCPEVPGVRPEKRMEVRFFAPGGLVSNLDFVESIFGNAGDPNLPENDAALDTAHWTGHTGCVILAPHLRGLKKKDLGLPHVSAATDRQKAEGMCWVDADELYNGGGAFKITLRDERGIMVTILADNYFGYCKKEVKTQIGLSANLAGLAEEEHAGGALAFAAYNLGSAFLPEPRIVGGDYHFAEAVALLGDTVTVHESGYATDKRFSNVHILPEDMAFDLSKQKVTWTFRGQEQSLRILPDHVYMYPGGYKVHLEKHPSAPSFRLIGTVPEGTFCHKPCTVSGGGKSEISKSLTDAVLYGPIYVGDFDADMAQVASIIDRDYSGAFRPGSTENPRDPGRALLSERRSLGSVIKLLTPNDSVYTAEHNEFVRAIPNHVRAIVFAIKRFYRHEWGSDWRSRFSVDIVNGAPGHELKLQGRPLVGSYLRVGLWKNGAWRTYKLRQDFIAAAKVQMEDDITASTIVPRRQLPGLPAEYSGHESLKLAENCEFRLFQRPDDAIHPGYDKQTEKDMSDPGLFVSNFQPLSAGDAREAVERVDLFQLFTQPMKDHLVKAETSDNFNICSAKPRIVGGKPTKNPRYLQVRPDVQRPIDRYLADLGARLYRRTPANQAVVFPVISVLSGRRNNPPDEQDGKRIRPLCVYGPIHYQELPELFMDYVCSVTGKSPSTTGAGSEGALTKGPFNAITATADLNNALVSMLLTGYAGFSSAAGWIGPNCRVDHDVSLLVPEVWCRLFPEERDPTRMIAAGHLEKVEDFTYEGELVEASRLGFRITERFVHTYFGRVFDNPAAVFDRELLQPETQDLACFVDGVKNLVEAQQKSALAYFEDGTIEDACPPLRVLLHIMAYGHCEGKRAADPEIRALFTREALLSSDWYRTRLATKQQREVALWRRHVASLEAFLARPGYDRESERLSIRERLEAAKKQLVHVSSAAYLDELEGTLGADPVYGKLEAQALVRRSLENGARHSHA
ncbi:MAG TPA: hypothetical protein VLC09_03010 [Polyangiaceae bacterium]|nr:hypothetical protein [Polyangiaceae bacterium]